MAIVKIDAKRRIVLMIENIDLKDVEYKTLMVLSDNNPHRLNEIYEYVMHEEFEPYNSKKNNQMSAVIRHLTKKGFPIIKSTAEGYLEFILDIQVFIG